jgi:hypothetical protein
VIRPIVILGKGPEAADLALHRVLRFKECAGPLLVLDWIGRGAPLLHGDNAGGISKRPVAWCDLANRQRPVGVFGLRASGALHGLLSGVLAQLRAPTHASLRDEALAWAADVGARLAEEGEVGLAAWHQTLRRPDVKRWFPSAQTSPDEREALARMLSWALRFPSVYTVSEAPNRVPLTTALQKMQTTWIEMPVEQFEPLEHRVVTLLVQAALWDGLWRSKATGPAGATPERVSTVLQLFPLATEPALTERLKGTASGARHLAVFALSADRAPGPALKDWIDAGADIWVIGQRGLPVAPLTPWLGDDARRRLSSLEGGDLWVRSGATGRAIVVKVRRSAPVTADVLDFRDLVPMDVGVPQGSPISPLLANVYLDPLDRHFEERRLDFVRYADDFLVFAADEPKALDALRAMATFLHDPLRLALKPAKTAHVRVTEGVDFLGFRLSGGSVAIQPDKVDRATAALHAWLAVLGAPHTSFLERTRTLGRVNGLVRGFRAYYALPDEPAILSQLRHLDRAVEEFAQETLPADLRNDPAWLARERFAASAPEDDGVPPLLAHNVYPEERVPPSPSNWMVKRDPRSAPSRASPPRRTRSCCSALLAVGLRPT